MRRSSSENDDNGHSGPGKPPTYLDTLISESDRHISPDPGPSQFEVWSRPQEKVCECARLLVQVIYDSLLAS